MATSSHIFGSGLYRFLTVFKLRNTHTEPLGPPLDLLDDLGHARFQVLSGIPG